MKKNILYSAIGVISAAFMIGGCGMPFSEGGQQPGRELIELTTPIAFESISESVMRRNLYNAEVGTYTVAAYTETYAFSEDVRNIEYFVLPGTEVSIGDTLAASANLKDTEIENIQKELEKQAEEIESLKESYLQNSDEKTKKELDMKQELYNLDLGYKSKVIERLIEQRDRNVLKAGVQGVVSAIYDSTGSVKRGTAVVAVSDTSRKLIYTDFFKTSELIEAEDYYVVSNGVRYECERQECDEKNKSCFKIVDQGNKISVGDTCVFVLMKQHAEDVLSLSTELIKNDSSGAYVYIQKGSNPEKCYLSIGMSDGYFTEVTKGLSEGDKIVDSEAENDTGKRGTVTKADTFSESSERGFFFWPRSESINCDIKNGEVYITKYTVDLYESVEEGDVICEIYVVGDEVELERLQTQLQRAKERNASEESVKELSTKVEALLSDYSAKTITADKTGIVVGITEHKSGDVIKYGEELVQITDAKNCYVTVRNNNSLSFGNEVKISFINADRKQSEVKGKVINLGKNADSTTLKADYQLIQISDEDTQQLMKAQQRGNGRAGINLSFSIPQYIGVLAVPKAAVTVYSGNYSVNILEADGTIRKQCFLCLGSDKNNYYCLEGLKEGETVCLK